MAAIGKYSLSKFFVGQGELLLGAVVADYTTADVSAFDFTSLGDIKLDSTEWTGEDINTTNIQNEQGEIIASTSIAGTYSFDAVVMSTDQQRLIDLMKASNITVPADGVWFEETGAKITGLGVELPIIERPIALVNDLKNQSLVFSRAKIVTAFTREDKLFAMKISATAQKVDTDNLKTVMIIEGAIVYA